MRPPRLYLRMGNIKNLLSSKIALVFFAAFVVAGTMWVFRRVRLRLGKFKTQAPLPLHICTTTHNQVEILKCFLDLTRLGELKLETKNDNGETPLHLASKKGFNEVIELLLYCGADLEAKTNNMSTPLHLAVGHAVRTGDTSTVGILLAHGADDRAKDNMGLSPSDYLPKGLKMCELRQQNIDVRSNTSNSDHALIAYKNFEEPMHYGNVMKEKMSEFEYELSKIVGLKELKLQLRKWAKGMMLDEKRRGMGMDLGRRKLPHMAFLGNPGSGKTSVARILGKLLKSVGVLSSDKVTEVQRADLVAEYAGQTAAKTKRKINEAMGGVLLVDEAYRLAPVTTGRYTDFGVEALEEIMSVLEDGELVVIFAGYTEPMKRVFSSNEGFCRRVTHFLQFDDFTCNDLAEMLMLKMTKQDKHSRLYGFKLHGSCTSAVVRKVIEKNSTEKLRNKMNGGLVDHMLNNARENLDSRLSLESSGDELLMISLHDLEAGLQQLVKGANID